MAALTQQDLAQVAVLLKRLRTGELVLTLPSAAADPLPAQLFDFHVRVEAFLTEGIRRMDAPLGDGGPAFPVPGLHADESFNGMSLRDHFAAKALPTIIKVCGADDRKGTYEDHCAKHAYVMADAMIRARTALKATATATNTNGGGHG